ncbi:MAG: translocation/assembly module TamB domain-containing protein, partial [Chitinophagaceae bacterium]
SKGIEFTLQPSDIIINNRSWQIQEAASVFVGANDLTIENLGLRSGQQQIVAYTYPSEITNTQDIVVDMRKLQMGDFLPYFFNDPRLEGSITGRVNISDPLNKLQIDAALTTEQFIFNNDSIGLLQLKGSYNHTSSTIRYELTYDNLYYDFDARGFVRLRDSSSEQMSHTIRLRNTKLSPLETYLSGILKNLNGTATGTIQLAGTLTSPDLTGTARLKNADFILDYTQCKYFVEDTDLRLNKGEIDFGNMRLRDSTNRYARFGGKIYHRFFQKMGFDLSFKTENDQRGLLVLNTTKKDNSLFHGKVFARATGTLKGPLNNMVLKISGAPTDSSSLALYTSDTRVTSSADYIVFRRYGKDMEAESNVNEVSSLLLDLDIIANPLASVDIVLDETTKDIVHGRGNGFLNIRVGTNESLTMNGNYEITRGEYTFNWQSLIKKPFTIDKGSIVWSGDPYNAKINMEATYTAREVYLPQQAIQGASNERGDIMIVGELTNTLLNPNIRFRFELPPGNPWRNNPLTMAGLKSIQDNPDEMNKQVASVLLFNGFIGAQQSTQGGSWLGANVATGVAGTISQFLSQQLSSTLKNFVEKVLGLKNFDPYVTINPNLAMGFQANQGVIGTGTFGFTQRLL